MHKQPTQRQLSALDGEMETLDLPGRLHCIARFFDASDLGMTIGLGYSGMILLRYVCEILPTTSFYFINTRFHFPETLGFFEKIRQHWNLNVHMLETPLSEEEIEQQIGNEAYIHDPNSCCDIRKVKPLNTILPTKKAWIHAIRRDQSPTRSAIPFVRIQEDGFLRFYPMADWTSQQCWDFIRKHDIPYHPLHEKNYPSVGCTHCTSPVPEGAPERSGRWTHFKGKLECGLHGNPKWAGAKGDQPPGC